MAAYSLAIEGQGTFSSGARCAPSQGTIGALIKRYFASGQFKTLAPSTQRTYRLILERFCLEHGDKPFRRLERRHIRNLLDQKTESPSAANNLLKLIKIVMKFAIDIGELRDDPTVGIRKFRIRTSGFYAWDEEDIARFEKCYSTGTR